MLNISLDSGQIKPLGAIAERPLWIVTAPYRRQFGCWAEVHAMSLQGWFFIRLGNALVGHYGDVEEGRA